MLMFFLLVVVYYLDVGGRWESESFTSNNVMEDEVYPNFDMIKDVSFSDHSFNETPQLPHGNRKEIKTKNLTTLECDSSASPRDLMALQHQDQNFQEKGKMSNNAITNDQLSQVNSKLIQKRDLISQSIIPPSLSREDKMASVLALQDSKQINLNLDKKLNSLSQINDQNAVSLRKSRKNVQEMDQVDLLKFWEILTTFLWQNHLNDCHVISITPKSSRSSFSILTRTSFRLVKPLTLVDLEILGEDKERLLQDFWGPPTITCRGLLIDIATSFTYNVFKFLEDSKLWQWPEARVVFLGRRRGALGVLAESAFRNTIQPVFIEAFNEDTPNDFNQFHNIPGKVIRMYTRCLYCNYGLPKVKLVHQVPLENITGAKIDLPTHEKMLTFHGRVIRVSTLNYYPYTEFKLDTDEPGTTVTLVDSLDKRIFDSIAAHANITFIARISLDGLAGYLLQNGTWTGVIGDLVEETADISTSAVLTPERAQVMDITKTCETDRMVIVSLAPQTLPEYLVIIKPFTGEVWLYVFLSVLLWAISLWATLKCYSFFTKKKNTSLNEAIFFSWAVILEDPPPSTPSNSSGQMLVCWWLIACLLITTAFKSALVAHLTVKSKASPIDSYEDLLKLTGWSWGFEKKLLRGGPLFYFKFSPDPKVQDIYRKLEGINSKEGLEKVKHGGYSLLGTKNRVMSFIDLYQSDFYGRHPFYFSKTSYRIASDIGIGFRKGVPFKSRFSELIYRLSEAGIIDYWIRDVLADQARETRRKKREQLKKEGAEIQDFSQVEVDDQQVVLQLTHLTGVFLLYLIGTTAALLVFFLENV